MEFKKGQEVECLAHGTKFTISDRLGVERGVLYYNKKGCPCPGQHTFNGSTCDGVPECKLKLIKEAKTYFQVGDRVEQIRFLNVGESMEATVTKVVEGDEIWHRHDVKIGKDKNSSPESFRLIKRKEEPMDMRERIEGLTGWDCEANDLLQEIFVFKSEHYYLKIGIGNSNEITIENYCDEKKASFRFYDVNEKLQAFKDALLWLAEKAGLLTDNKKEIDELKQKVEEATEALKEANERLEKLL